MAQQTKLEGWVQQAGVLQQSLVAARTRLMEAEVTGTAGGGAVAVRLSAAGELLDIRIDPASADDVSALERHIVAAHAQALADARQLTNEMVGTLTDLANRMTREL